MHVKPSLPLVSVIVTTYNYGRFLEEAIRSVLRQTVPARDVELIVVDDGSTDDTRERMRKYNRQLTYVYKVNQGQASAFNAGFEIARGEYIALLDADDVWYPDKLEKLIRAYGRPGTDVVCHNLVLWNGTHRMGLAFPYRTNGWMEGYCPPTSGISFRRNLLKYLYPVPLSFRVSADLFLICVLNLVGCRVLFSCEPWGAYRVHGENLYTGTLTADRANRRIAAYRALLACLEDESFWRQRGCHTEVNRDRLRRSRLFARAAIQELQIAKENTLWKRVGRLVKALQESPGLGVYTLKLLLVTSVGYSAWRKIMDLYHGVRYQTLRGFSGAEN